ncbi:MAG: protein kinase [Bryobacteraceae bacterium]
MIGQRVGQYEIIDKLGEGGMGVVWRGHDSRLNRDAAIKVLAAGELADSASRQRLIREARAASALNHPNIVTIYDIGDDWVAMEYVPGQNLAHLINGKPLRSKDAHNYARQIAGALAAAHDAGILHRDLKPGNIMVTPEGRVKVLDFGLAKQLHEASPQDATVKAGLTEKGMLLGTFAYMSPEQAQGKKLDARSDIFSFGVLLYEMVTGRRAFESDSAASTMSMILRDDPPPPTETSDILRRVIDRCLEKNPARRFQHAADIEWMLEQSNSPSTQAATPAEVPQRRLPSWAALALAAAGGIAIGAGVMALRAPQPMEFWDTEVLTYSGRVAAAAISPDGNEVAFVMAGDGATTPDLYVKSAIGGTPRRITNDQAIENSPAWSADGKRIAFTRRASREDTATLYVLSLAGGPARKIGNAVIHSASGLSWSSDDRFLVATCGKQICLTEIATGEMRTITKPEAVANDQLPVFAADGKRLAFIRRRSFYNSGIFLLDLSGKTPGAPRSITTGSVRDIAVTPDGSRIAFISDGSGNRDLWTAKSDGTEAQPLARAGEMRVGSPRWSPDGSQIAFDAYTHALGDIYIIGQEGGAARRLTPEPSAESRPSWSRDGKWIYFTSDRTGRAEVWKAPIGGGPAIQITRDGGDHAMESVDGKSIFFYNRKGENAIWKQDLNSNVAAPVGSFTQMSNWTFGSRHLYWADATRLKLLRAPLAGGEPELVRELEQELRLGTSGTNLATSDDESALWLRPVRESRAHVVVVHNFR